MSKTENTLFHEMSVNGSTINPLFQLCDSDKQEIEKMSQDDVCRQVDSLRELLEYAGKKCSIYRFLINHFEGEIKQLDEEDNDYAVKRWRELLQTHIQVYDLMGYLTLLQMDAIASCISLYIAKSDTERIMLCKHSYTIIYEAINTNIFKTVSSKMQKYPDDILNKDKLSIYWRSIKKVLKYLSNIDEAKIIRHNLDAHKNPSFTVQIDAYQKCRWSQSITNLQLLMTVIESLQECMDVVNKNMRVVIDSFFEKLKERVRKLDQLKEMLLNFDEGKIEMHN